MNKNIIAPLSGTIVEVLVHPGDDIVEGQAVVILEAMKMENEIQAEYSGRVVSINVAEGEKVGIGTELVTIE